MPVKPGSDRFCCARDARKRPARVESTRVRVTRRVPTGTVCRKGRNDMAGMMREEDSAGVERRLREIERVWVLRRDVSDR
jgi:hypothetical protein